MWATQWGNASDIPVAGDYDGDRRMDSAVFRPGNGTWYFRVHDRRNEGNSMGQWPRQASPWRLRWRWENRRRSLPSGERYWYLLYSSNGAYVGRAWGNSADTPAPADYDGDGRTDIAVFRPGNGDMV